MASPSSANLLANMNLLRNPLALALESMRDPSDDVCMTYIHPLPYLASYFENILCLSCPPPDGRTEIGVRVALGDTGAFMVPATTEMLIFGDTFVVHLSYIPNHQRSTHHPSYPTPRPDDPTPRKPPIHTLTRKQTIRELAANTRIKINANGKEDDSEVVRRAREVMLHLPNSKSCRRGKEKERAFKVPALPANHAPDADVFGLVSDPKGKARAVDEGIGDIEQENKSVCPSLFLHVVALNITFQIIKKFTVRHLDAVGVSKSHPEFKEVFGFVYRGTAFALRATIKKSPVSALALDTLVEAHIKLYVT
ncbi:hypothetical protein DFH29DRAFT_1009424 [Suillus ampliporus]|nr:hypothetical protein DFH29DRAFT_1009424 [Suillus ampliporus]